jgi:hypothetical protein
MHTDTRTRTHTLHTHADAHPHAHTQVILESEAYREESVNRAQGEAEAILR